MRITFLIIGLLCMHGCWAQLNHRELRGEWRLNSLFEKEISSGEKQKRYTFKKDSLYYSSVRQNVSGTYLLEEATGQILWRTAQFEKPVMLWIKRIHQDTLHVREGGEHAVTGVLVRISAQSIVHYQKAMEAQANKKFNLAFSELQLSAQLCHPDAMYLLGMYYFTGTATKLDEKEGSRWIRKAAEAGNRQALSVESSLRN